MSTKWRPNMVGLERYGSPPTDDKMKIFLIQWSVRFVNSSWQCVLCHKRSSQIWVLCLHIWPLRFPQSWTWYVAGGSLTPILQPYLILNQLECTWLLTQTTSRHFVCEKFFQKDKSRIISSAQIAKVALWWLSTLPELGWMKPNFWIRFRTIPKKWQLSQC